MPQQIANKSLFLLYSKDRTLLYISKNGNFQNAMKKSWWPDVHHIITQHFDSFDDLEHAKYQLLNSYKPKWNIHHNMDNINSQVITALPQLISED